MTENVVIDFTANTQGIDATIDRLVKLGQVTEEEAKGFKAIGEAGKKAGDDMAAGASKAKESISPLSKAIEELGTKIIAAFAVERVIEFGKESVKAYADSQRSALQLLGAVNGNVAAQKALIEGAAELSKRYAIPEAAIVSQQKFLAVNGRTEDQIQKTIKAAIELSAVTGEDLGTSVFKLNGTFEGTVGKLGKLDARFREMTAAQLESGAAIDLVLKKYQGFAEKGLEGVAGSMQKLDVQIEETKVKLGEMLAPLALSLQQGEADILTFFEDFTKAGEDFFSKNKSILNPANWFGANDKANALEQNKKLLDEQTAQAKVAFENFNADKLASIIRANQKELQASKDLNNEQRISLEGEVNAAAELLRLKLDANKADKESVGILDGLKAKLEDLKKELGKATTKNAAADILKQITDVQNQIDEITGKAAEERAKKKEEADKKAFEEQKKHDEELKKQAEEHGKWMTDTFNQVIEDEAKRQKEADKESEKQAKDHALAMEDLLNSVFEAEGEKRKSDIEQEKEYVRKRNELEKGIADETIKAAETYIKGRGELQLRALDDEQTALDESYAAQQKALDDKLNNHKISQKKHDSEMQKLAQQNAAAHKKIDNEIAAEKRKQAIQDREMAIFGIIVNTALAIAKTEGQTGFVGAIPLIPLLIAMGAAEIATVLAQPLPKFAKGVERFGGKGTATSDSNLAWLSAGERVVDAKTNNDYFPTLSAIHNHKINPKLINEFVLRKDLFSRETPVNSLDINYSKLASELAYEIKTNSRRSMKIENFDELANILGSRINPRQRN